MRLFEDMLEIRNKIYEHVGCDYLDGNLIDYLDEYWTTHFSPYYVYYGKNKDELGYYSIEINPSKTYPTRIFRGDYYTLVIGDDGCGNYYSYLFLTSKEVSYK